MNQAENPAEVNKTYIFFLVKGGDYYYEVDGQSQLKEVNGTYRVSRDGLKGQFTAEELKKELELKREEFKN